LAYALLAYNKDSPLMTRSELIAKMAQRFKPLTLSDAELSVKAILDAMSDELAVGGRVEIRGFGAFSVTIRPPRIARNPKTGERVNVPAKASPHFKVGLELRERVKG
jgi:integration host factor subunit beta